MQEIAAGANALAMTLIFMLPVIASEFTSAAISYDIKEL